MGREYKFLKEENKGKQKEFLTKVANILNEHYKSKGVNKTVSVEEFETKINDKEKQETYKKCQDFMFDILDQKGLHQEYEKKYGINVYGAFKRVASSNLLLIEENDPNKDEKERRNVEFLKSIAPPNDIRKLMKDTLKEVFNQDLTKFYPKDTKEAIDSYMENKYLFEKSFAIQSMYDGAGLYVNPEFAKNYEYYKTTIEGGSAIKSMIEKGQSEFSLFMPDDLTAEDVVELSVQMNSLASEYKDILYTDSKGSILAYTTFMSSVINKDEQKFNDYQREFFEKNDKNHDFLLKHNIGGENFQKELEKCFKNETDPNILGSINNAEVTIDEADITLHQRNIKLLIDSKDNKLREIVTGKFTADLYSNLNKEKLDSNKDIRCDAIINFIHTENSSNKNIKNVNKTLDNALKEAGITEHEISSYKKIINKEVDFKYVESVGKHGFNLTENAPQELKEQNAFNSLESYSTSELKERMESGNLDKDLNANKRELFSIAKTISDRNKKRGLFSKIFSRDAWRERSMLKKIEKAVDKNDISFKDYNDFLKGNNGLNDLREFERKINDKPTLESSINANNKINSKSELTTERIEVKELNENVVENEVNVNTNEALVIEERELS